MNCLNNIVGLSRTGCDCPCLDISPSSSLSDLYLDDSYMGRIPLSAAVYDCSDEDVTSFLNRLVPDSVKEVNRMLYISLEQNLVPRYRDFNFKLPRKESHTRQLEATSGYYFMNLKPKYQRGSVLRINKIRIPSTTGTILIRDEYGNNYYTGTQAAFTALNLVFDREYYICYQSVTRPYNYEFSCNCGGESKEWKKYAYLGGGIVDSLNDLDFKESNYSYGVILEGTFSCDPFAPLCDMDFLNNNWGRVYAMSVMLVARKNLIGWILSSGQVTNYLTTNGDELPGLLQVYQSEIDQRIKFLPQAYNLTDCYQCGMIGKGEIIV